MEERIGRGNSVRQSSLRPNGSYKSTLSGRSTPRNSPSFRRLHSSRTPRRDSRSSGSNGSQWFRSNRIVYWLLLITLWAYLGFYVRSRWAHGNNKEEIFAFGSKQSNEISDSQKNQPSGQQKATVHVEGGEMEEQEQEIPTQNTTYGMLVGPFGSLEDKILEWGPEKRSGTCERKGEFARLVWSRKFVLIFHELSLTGAPLSMLELTTELMSCGAMVTVIVLNKRGGLMAELSRRNINVLEDTGELSFKVAKKADLIIAGSAVCASWIDQYMEHFTTGSSQIAWYIRENRMEYFNQSKVVLDSVRMLIFISESQSKQWRSWCEEEKIKLYSETTVVPLSVNDELAFLAGLMSSLNTPYFSTEKMLEKRNLLRDAVRKEMGLTDNEILVMSLSNIYPGKGQLLLLESARLVIEQNLSHNHSAIRNSVEKGKDQPFKVLIGSVGSKGNMISYIKGLLGYLSQHSDLSKSVLWTPSTTHVAALYSAADVYVMNSQGQGETFGRVTIEAMAFGLPVLGTDAGGTKEIVEHNVTGLLHPLGSPGIQVLAQNLQFLLHNPSVRQQMGMEGRKKVEKMYLKQHMYKKLAEAFHKCLRIK